MIKMGFKSKKSDFLILTCDNCLKLYIPWRNWIIVLEIKSTYSFYVNEILLFVS